MDEAGRELDLTKESLRAHETGVVAGQHLHRYLPAVPKVVGEVHCAHASRANHSEEAVAVAQVRERVRSNHSRGDRL
jgi:hypothetical protein